MKAFDLTEVGFVKRVVVGNSNPEDMQTEDVLERQMKELNRCLSSLPKGRIIGQEKNFYILHIGEHQVVMQYVVYHIGFARRPAGMK